MDQNRTKNQKKQRHKTCLQLVLIILFGLCICALWWRPACTAVELADDGLHDLLQLLLLGLELLQVGVLVRLHPLDLLLHGLLDDLLVLVRQLAAQLLLVADLVLQGVGVALQLVARVDALLQLLVLVGESLGVVHHAVDVLWRQAVLVVGDGDLVLVARALVLGGDAQDAVHVDLEGHLDLGYAAWCRGDASQVEGAQEMVVLGQGTLA